MSMNNDDNVTPSTPDPQLTDQVAAIIRLLLGAAASIGIYHGATNGAWVPIVAGVIVSVGTILWSIWQHRQAAAKAHASILASLARGTAVRVTKLAA